MLKDHHASRNRLLILRIFPVLTSIFLASIAPAAVSVDPPQTITHQVVVQPIRVKKSDGSIADFMGTASSEAYIKNEINRIWAQVGVRIDWLAPVDYTSDFAYDGSPANYTTRSRPTSHLNTIVNNSGTPPRSSDPKVLNLFFVRIPAGFSQLNSNTSAGLAYIDRNGSTIYVGSSLLTFTSGRDVVASVIAHEIGHNLGLDHFSNGTTNLMYSRTGSEPSGTPYGEMLVASQSTTIFTNHYGTDGYDFLQPLPPQSHYLTWADLHDLSGGPEDDDDLDTLSNAFEFLYGSSPTAFTPHPAASINAQGLTWNLAKSADALADGFSYIAESSLTLESWRPAGSANSGSSILTDNTSTFSVRLNAGYPQAFIRFDVIIPAGLEERETPVSIAAENGAQEAVISDGHQRTAVAE
ncbi:zinc-dependent metalloprotease family protein [Haloferula chungangensis]|uniref:Zinc-dependent metalloprotease family protein n=1 Tax=Haloferula chungangensis TaxID=1048331 RepID=A0ABW2L4F8_9BACT